VEAAIVMLSDSVVSTIEYIEKSEENKFTTNKIIDNIFQMRMDKGTFDGANLSLKDFKMLKEFYQKEFKR
jgi:membrane-associated HD superfamily phosphohydrolase